MLKPSAFVLTGVMALTLTLSSVLPVSAGADETSEATVFFNEVLQHTDNPVIANLAKENLNRLKGGSALSAQVDNAYIPVSYGTSAGSAYTKAATVPAVAPKVSDGVEVPLLKGTFSRNLVVPALLNRNVNGTFIVDTGATYSVITPAMARELGVDVNHTTKRIPILTANGWIQAPMVEIGQMSLGNVEVRNVKAVVQDLGGDPMLSGLLGMNFFSDMELTIRRDKLILRVGYAD